MTPFIPEDKVTYNEMAPSVQAKFDSASKVVDCISSKATETNKLLSESEVDEKINNISAFPIYKDGSQTNFNTRSELFSATTYYDATGKVRVPSANDYTFVLQDETHTNHLTRYIHTGTTWAFQIEVNFNVLNAGTGITINNEYINHSNSVTEVTTQGLLKISHDKQGHITSSSTMSIDTSPVSNSSNLVTSGGVYNAINTSSSTSVPTTRTINGKALSSNITLSASDIGISVLSSSSTTNQAKYLKIDGSEYKLGSAVSVSSTGSSTNKVKYITIDGTQYLMGVDVDASLSSSSVNPVQNKVINSALAGKVPTTRTINSKALSSNITLTASDIGISVLSSSSTTNQAKYLKIDGSEYKLGSAVSVSTSGSATNQVKYITIDGTTNQFGLVLNTVSSLSSVSANPGFYKYSGTIAGTNGTWGIISLTFVYIAINLSDPCLLYVSSDLSTWHHPYGSWK